MFLIPPPLPLQVLKHIAFLIKAQLCCNSNKILHFINPTSVVTIAIVLCMETIPMTIFMTYYPKMKSWYAADND